MNFGYVPHPFGDAWRDARRLLDKAVTKGGNRWIDVVRALSSGRAQLWLAIEGRPTSALVTRMDGTTLEVWLCGGAVLGRSLGCLETVIAAARQDGATDGRIVGRKGWLRVLKPYGWRQAGDELVKSFNEGTGREV